MRSPFFRELLYGDRRSDKIINLPDCPAEPFRRLLEYGHTGSTLLDAEYVMELMMLADQFELVELKEMCGQYAADAITVATASALLEQAMSLEEQQLFRACLQFVEANTMPVLQSPGFQRLSLSALCTVLDSSELTVDSEFQVRHRLCLVCSTAFAAETPPLPCVLHRLLG